MSPLRSDDYSLAASHAAQLAQNTVPGPTLSPSLTSLVSAPSTPLRALPVDALPIGAAPASPARPVAPLVEAGPHRPWWEFRRKRALKAKQVKALRYFSLVMARTLAFAGEQVQPYDAAKAEACIGYARMIAEVSCQEHFDSYDLQVFKDASQVAHLALMAIRDGYPPNDKRERRRLRKRMASTDVPSLAEGILKQMQKKEKWLTKLLMKTGSAVPKQVPTPPRFA